MDVRAAGSVTHSKVVEYVMEVPAISVNEIVTILHVQLAMIVSVSLQFLQTQLVGKLLAWSAVKVCRPLNIAAKRDGAGAFCSVVWVVVKLIPPTFRTTFSLPEKT